MKSEIEEESRNETNEDLSDGDPYSLIFLVKLEKHFKISLTLAHRSHKHARVSFLWQQNPFWSQLREGLNESIYYYRGNT
jgi:hypothetical protein